MNPSLGMGLEGLADWSAQQPFIDVMKTSRAWTGHLPGQWGGYTADQLEANGYLDKDGWLLRMPPEVESVQLMVLTSLPAEAQSVTGRYRLTYQGQGRFELIGASIAGVSPRPGVIWFRYRPGGDDPVAISILSTDPGGTGDYLRDFSLVHEDNIAAHEAGALFNPDWIDRIEDLRSVRFMDWMQTNDSQVQSWDDRPEVGDYTYVDGVPLEVMVELANQIGADPWFNMPHMADDEYVRNFAEYVRDNLDPDLRAYVEYSNEVWNFIFEQATWATEQAEARWGAGAAPDAWLQYYGMRAAEVAGIWDDVFGADADARVINTVATHTGWPGLEQAIFDAPLYVAEGGGNRPPSEIFDAYAVTGYFGLELGGERAGEVLGWIADSEAAARAEADAQGLTGAARTAYIEAHRFDQASAVAAEDLRTGSLAELIGETFVYHAAVAEANGMELVMYEGGTHVVGLYENTQNQTLTEFFNHFNYTIEMAELYSILLEGWQAAGGTLFNAFVDVSDPSQYGSWGALRHLDDDNPRWDVLNEFNNTVAAWWEDRPEDTFDQGVFLTGGDGADELVGTSEEDILLGGRGNDTLFGNGGEDRLHGGTGQDTAWLIGSRADYTFTSEDGTLIATHSSGTTFLTDIENIIFEDQDQQVFAVSQFL
ncbi:MAG: hypothetical protein AAFY59_05130 [Pseudomonadota bacterium]